jgi:hypothetical protein
LFGLQISPDGFGGAGAVFAGITDQSLTGFARPAANEYAFYG